MADDLAKLNDDALVKFAKSPSPRLDWVSTVTTVMIAIGVFTLIVMNLTGQTNHGGITDSLLCSLVGFTLIRVARLQRQQEAIIEMLDRRRVESQEAK